MMVFTPQCYKISIQNWQGFNPITNLPTPLDILEHWTKYAKHPRSQNST